MGYVFISYENEDRDFAEALIHRLKILGISVWEQPSVVHVSEEQYTTIEQALRNASVFVIIMTPTARASKSVTYEWIFALGVGVPIIPIVLKDTILHPRLTQLSRFNFTNHTTRPWDALLEAVQKTITEVEPHRILLLRGIPSYIQEAIKALDNANPDDREGAIDNLAQADHPAAVEALVGALSHPLQDVRIFAALARGKTGDARAIPELLVALDQEDEGISNDAIIALGNIGDVTVVPYLIHTLYRRWDRSRYLIADAFEKMGDATVPVLQNILHEENVERKIWAVQTLKEIGEAAVPSLIQALQDKEQAVKVYAIGALSDIKEAAAVPNLIEVLASNNEEWSIRENAAEALGKIGDTSAVLSLIQALSYDDDSVRRAAAKALRQIGSGAVPSLIEILGTTEGDVRRRIHTLLKQIGTPEAIGAINTKFHRKKKRKV